MIFKNIKQLKNQLTLASEHSYLYSGGLVANKKSLIDSTLDVSDFKIFYAGDALDVRNKFLELIKGKESSAILKEFKDVTRLPFQRIMYVVNLQPPKPILGEVKLNRNVKNTLLISIDRFKDDELGVVFYMDVSEADRRNAARLKGIDQSNVDKGLRFLMNEVCILCGSHGTNSITSLLHLHRPVSPNDPNINKMSDAYTDLVIELIAITMYYSTLPVVEKPSTGKTNNPSKAKQEDKGYIIDYSKPRVKYEQFLKEKKGTHSPPREHSREGHKRYYKSGKVVEVKGCIVNKGNIKGGETQYKLKGKIK